MADFMTKVIITGARGRMGQALVSCAKSFPRLEVVAALGRDDDLAAVIARSEVVIDFSSPLATRGFVELCTKNQKAIVIGTTGHAPQEIKVVSKAKFQNYRSPHSNFSRGRHTDVVLPPRANRLPPHQKIGNQITGILELGFRISRHFRGRMAGDADDDGYSLF